MIPYFQGFACGIIPAFVVAVILFIHRSFSVVDNL